MEAGVNNSPAILEESLARLGLDLRALEQRLMEGISTMDAVLVPDALYEISEWDKTIGRIRQTIEAKAAGGAWAEAVTPGAAWKGPDGQFYKFGPSWSRKASDVEGLRTALVALVKEKKDLQAAELVNQAFRVKLEVLLTPLDSLAKMGQDYADAINEFVAWKPSGVAHLRPVER